MRFRPANISLINRRHYLPRLLLTLSSFEKNDQRSLTGHYISLPWQRHRAPSRKTRLFSAVPINRRCSWEGGSSQQSTSRLRKPRLSAGLFVKPQFLLHNSPPAHDMTTANGHLSTVISYHVVTVCPSGIAQLSSFFVARMGGPVG
jgi:hypothetical protein